MSLDHTARQFRPLDAHIQLDWLVPGFLEEKVAALVKSLPKEHSGHTGVPIPDTVKRVLAELRFRARSSQQRSMAGGLARLATTHRAE